MTGRLSTSPRKRPHQERAQDTVEALLGATARILVEQGYDRASTNRIARAAGVSIGSLYQYFPNKEALVAALIDRQAELEFAVARDKMAEVMGRPLPEAARELVEAMLAAHRVNPKLHKVLFEQVPRLGRMRKLLDLQHRAERLLCGYLEARRHELRPRNVELAVFLLVNAVESITHAAALNHPEYLGDDQLKEEVTALVVRYLIGEDARAMSKPLVLTYAGCDTCRKALRWLTDRGVAATVRPIVDEPPRPAELSQWVPQSGLPVRKWLNTSGQSYRALGKDKIDAADEATLLGWLAADGKLVKRPVLVHGGRVLVGFREADYAALFGG